MRITDIFQTLEYRGNEDEVEHHGPYFCEERESNGLMKTGVREPWLGEGYYFWDSRIANAHWWGKAVYKEKGYIVCKTTYDQHTPLLYDLLGVANHFEEFVECAKLIKEKRELDTIKVSVVLSYLKNHTPFNYKAIRVWPNPRSFKDSGIVFPGEKMVLGDIDKIQICFFDKTLLTEPFEIVDKNVFPNNQTI